MNNQYEICFTSKANSDYLNILELASNISFNYYQKLYKTINFHLKNLSENPYIYPKIKLKQNLRRVIINNYILVYSINKNLVIIQRIFSSKLEYIEYI